MSRQKYEQLVDGEWIAPARNGFVDVCCGCNFVHRVDYRVRFTGEANLGLILNERDFQVEFRAFRDNRKTAALRRSKAKTRADIAKRAHQTIKRMAGK